MTPASWQPDPMARHEFRWWDGEHWTDHVSDHGVASVDPLTPPAAPSAWAQPTVQQPTVQQPYLPQAAVQMTPTTPVAPQRRTAVIVSVIVAVAALSVGAFFLLKGDKDADDTTATIASVDDTNVPSSDGFEATTIPDTAPITTAPPVDGAGLVSAMLTTDETPDGWYRYEEPDPAPSANQGNGVGYCGGGNSVQRSQQLGGVAQAYGPAWDLPDGTSFGADVYAFADEKSAQALIEQTLLEATSCDAAPITYTMPESEATWLEDGFGDDAVWNVVEASTAEFDSSTGADDAVRATVTATYTTNVDGLDLSVSLTAIVVYERHGRSVIAMWLDGRWGFTGFDEVPTWAHQPVDADLDAAMLQVRDLMVERLQGIGAI